MFLTKSSESRLFRVDFTLFCQVLETSQRSTSTSTRSAMSRAAAQCNSSIPLPADLLTVRDGHLEVDVRDPGVVVAHYAGVIAVLAAGLLVVLLLPLAACCCGCCRRGEVKKSAPCVAPLLLGVLAGLAL